MEYLYHHKNGVMFKKVDTEDLDLLLDLKNESWAGTHSTQTLNSINQEDWFEKISRDHDCLYLMAYLNTIKTEKTVYDARIGTFKLTYINWINSVVNVGHDVFKPYRGKGYGGLVFNAGIDFCFEILNIHRVECEVIENNYASKLSVEKGGLVVEGVKKESVFKNGAYLNSFVMGLTVSDWKKLERIVEYGNSCNLSYSLRRRTHD